MEGMTDTEKSIVETYSILFKNLSENCKKALIEQLSVKEKEQVDDGFALSYGGWEGPEQSVEEIKAEIKANRTFKRKDVIFS
jgi:hypothetical protein